MEHAVNTFILGCGPAGAACGIGLQKKGFGTLIAEKRAFPRDKLCGGLVTAKTYRLIKAVWDMQRPGQELPADLFCGESSRVELWYREERLTESGTAAPFRFVKRAEFDRFLADLYRQAGGQLLETCTCVSLDPEGHRATLSNGDSVTFRHLVAADGALSAMRKRLGYPDPRLGFCLETRIPLPAGAPCPPVRIGFGAIPKGYGWVFPSGEELCVGLGGVYDKRLDYPAALENYLKQNGLPGCRKDFKGAFVPYGGCVDPRKGYPDAALIGDAGGFVDPIYGEGLYFALATGLAAARAVETGEQTGRPFHPVFAKETAGYAKLIRQGGKLQRLLFSKAAMGAFKDRIRHKDAFVGYYCDYMVSEYRYSYGEIWKMIRAYKAGAGRK